LEAIINAIKIPWFFWVILGMIITMSEMFFPVFLLFGVGIATIATGIVVYFYKLNLFYSLFVWTINILLFFTAWIFISRRKGNVRVGQSNYNFKTIGVAQESIEYGKRGLVVFEVPVMGSSKWLAYSKDTIMTGDKVKTEEIKGQLMRVELATPEDIINSEKKSDGVS